jgi:GxxExxY protein
LIHHALSYKVLGFAFSVHRSLGVGLYEAAYEDAFCLEMKRAGVKFERQKVFTLCHKGETLCGFIADIVVENTIVLELKAVAKLAPFHEAQLLNYLRVSRLPVGYLMNFNALRLDWKRFANTQGGS